MQKIATGASTLAMTGCLLVIASIAKQSHAIESNIKKRGAFRKRFSFLLFFVLHQLYERGFGVVASAEAHFEHAGVAAFLPEVGRAFGILGRILVENLFNERMLNVLGALFESHRAFFVAALFLAVVHNAHNTATSRELFGTVVNELHFNLALVGFARFHFFIRIGIRIYSHGKNLVRHAANLFRAVVSCFYFSVPKQIGYLISQKSHSLVGGFPQFSLFHFFYLSDVLVMLALGYAAAYSSALLKSSP